MGQCSVAEVLSDWPRRGSRLTSEFNVVGDASRIIPDATCSGVDLGKRVIDKELY